MTPEADRAGGGRAGRSLRRLFGLDRSGPDPAETRSGMPLRPLTLPNAIGFMRLAAIPVFLVVAFGSEDGRSTTAALLFCAIAAGDYLDGLAARLTGQFSRLGALMDPFVDRVAILSGAVVAWHFGLLPRWAIAVLAAREVAMLAVAQWGLRRGVEVPVSWSGRIAVVAIMLSLPLAMLWDIPVASWLFVGGVVLAVVALALYIRAGIRAGMSAQRSSSG